ncbi:MAG: gluconeogenesis factor YvcK family protein [Patescibacteria group bacterium]|jgi:uncharacterized cofD-like protein
MKQTHLVTIGGGSGQSLLLRYLKPYPLTLTAIVSMVDDGGSTGILRKRLGVMPPGDVRRCLVALAHDPKQWDKVINHRMASGHTIGNLLLAGLEIRSGSIAQAIKTMNQWLQISGKVLPVTVKPTTLYAELMSGEIVVGETNIDVPNQTNRSPIRHIYLKPAVPALPSVIKAIQQADYIIFTIGDLYTSILPNVLVKGVTEALQHTRAKLVYTCNRTTKYGETNSYTAADYANTISSYIGRSLDVIVVDKTIKTDRTTKHLVKYNQVGLEQAGITVVERNLRATDPKKINGQKLARVIYKLCQP